MEKKFVPCVEELERISSLLPGERKKVCWTDMETIFGLFLFVVSLTLTQLHSSSLLNGSKQNNKTVDLPLPTLADKRKTIVLTMMKSLDVQETCVLASHAIAKNHRRRDNGFTV